MADIFKKNKPSEAEEAVKAAVTDEAFNTVTDDQVSKERQETGRSIDNTMDKVTEGSVADIDSANSGANGVRVSNLFKKVTGAPKAMAAAQSARMARGWTDLGTPTNYSAADADHLERNAQMAAIAFENVHADILREATAGTENGDTVIIGTPGDNNVYSEETDITTRTIVGEGVYYPSDHPRKREAGTLLARKSSFVSISGDYIHGSQVGSTTYRGHDSQKNFHEYENLLFNKLTNAGALDSNAGAVPTPKFVMPKRGRFWLKGISLKPSAASPLTSVGTVKRQYGESTLDCPVYQATGNGIFEVVELTPTLDIMTNAAAETARLLTCAKAKFSLGQAEAVAQIFAKAQEVIDQPTEIVQWPEYARTGRSTLSFCNMGANTPASCYNDIESYAEFMHYLQESEIMHAVHRINNEGLKSNLKFMRNMEGQNAKYPYWNTMFAGNPNNPDNCCGPTAAVYAATKSSTRSFNTMGKWIYTFRNFWSDLEAYCGAFDEGVLDDKILSVIKIGKDACDEIATQLKLGTIDSAEGMTSAVIAAAPNTVDIILGFDPNDLVDYTIDADGSVHAWLAAGYQNIYTRTSALDSEYVVYNIAPTWMQILLHAINSPSFIERIVNNPTRFGNSTFSMSQWFGAGRYAQLNIDTLRPSWLSLVIAEATLLFKEKVFSPRNQTSGFLRYLKASDEFGASAIYAYDVVPIHDVIREVCGSEGYFFKPTATNPTHFGKLDDAVIRERFDEDIYRPIAYIHDAGADGAKVSALVLQPDKIHSYINNLAGWQYRIGTNGDWNDFPASLADGSDEENNIPSVATLLEALKKKTFTLVNSPDGVDAILMGGDANALVFCRRKLDEQASLTVEVPQFGADDSVLGFKDNPESYLYAKDSFRNLAAANTYVMHVHFGRCNDAQVGYANTNLAMANVSMVPALIGSAASTEVDFNANVATGRKLLLMSTKDGRNQLFNGNDRVTARTINDVNNVGVIASIPSLWGYKRQSVCGAGHIVYSPISYASARGASITEPQPITSGATNLQGYQMIGWKPRSIAAELNFPVGSDDPAAVAAFIPFKLDTTAVGDWKWYSMQDFVAGDDLSLCDSSNQKSTAYSSVANLIESCGYVCDPVFLSGYANAITMVNVGAQDQDGNSIASVKSQSTGRQFDFNSQVQLRDFSDLYFSQLWSRPTLVETNFACKDTAGYTEVAFIGPRDAMRNLATLSRLYRNDIRAYKTDRPVLKLNRNWYIYGLTTPLFVDRFSN